VVEQFDIQLELYRKETLLQLRQTEHCMQKLQSLGQFLEHLLSLPTHLLLLQIKLYSFKFLEFSSAVYII
jgi:hypothetical protein